LTARHTPAGRQAFAQDNRAGKAAIVEVRIGVQNVAREIVFESTESVDDVNRVVEEALKKGGTLNLTDDKGRRYLVPVTALGYVNIGESERRGVGFGTV
jgi:Protein of unknown function (DUF3107)